MSLALLFPGQGSQHVGMCRELAGRHPLARSVVEEADAVLGFSLSRLMWEGPEEELTRTENAQPALLVHSIAVHRVLGKRLGVVGMAAGHSLGEFSAHVVAGTLALDEALRLVRRRGELMSAAGAERPGTMAAILGLSDDEVQTVCDSVTSGLCVPANFNTDGQVVVSGDREGVAEGMERAKEAGAKRAVELNVSGAFHSELMAPVADGLRRELAGMLFRDPIVPVFSNVTAGPVVDGEEARRLLIEQLTSPVRWRASIEAMVVAGADGFAELGPGRVLCGLNRRNARELPCLSVGTEEDVIGYES